MVEVVFDHIESEDVFMYRIGLSSCGKTISSELFAAYREAGIADVEISTPTAELDRLNFQTVCADAKANGVHVHSLHLPFVPFPVLDISSPTVAEATVEHHRSLIRRAGEAGIKLFIVHPSAEPIEEEDRAARIAVAKRSLAALAEAAAEVGGVIALENLPRTCLGRSSDEILEMISADGRIRVCFDTNHLLSEDPVHFIRAVGGKIVTTHVSDYDLKNERHWLPGEGVTDWGALYAALVEIGYTGPWLYELGFTSPKTVVRERDLCCHDFVRNANEIFSGKPLTRLSTPVEGLPSWR